MAIDKRKLPRLTRENSQYNGGDFEDELLEDYPLPGTKKITKQTKTTKNQRSDSGRKATLPLMSNTGDKNPPRIPKRLPQQDFEEEELYDEDFIEEYSSIEYDQTQDEVEDLTDDDFGNDYTEDSYEDANYYDDENDSYYTEDDINSGYYEDDPSKYDGSDFSDDSYMYEDDNYYEEEDVNKDFDADFQDESAYLPPEYDDEDEEESDFEEEPFNPTQESSRTKKSGFLSNFMKKGEKKPRKVNNPSSSRASSDRNVGRSKVTTIALSVAGAIFGLIIIFILGNAFLGSGKNSEGGTTTTTQDQQVQQVTRTDDSAFESITVGYPYTKVKLKDPATGLVQVTLKHVSEERLMLCESQETDFSTEEKDVEMECSAMQNSLENYVVEKTLFVKRG